MERNRMKERMCQFVERALVRRPVPVAERSGLHAVTPKPLQHPPSSNRPPREWLPSWNDQQHLGRCAAGKCRGGPAAPGSLEHLALYDGFVRGQGSKIGCRKTHLYSQCA